MLETERFILRPWCDADAATLFRWASDPRVGPPANWAPYVSIEHARETLHAVYCAPDTFAICMKRPEEFDAATISRIEGEADFGDMTRGFFGPCVLARAQKGGFGPVEPHWQYQVRQARPCQLRYRGQRSGNGNLAGCSLLGFRHRSRSGGRDVALRIRRARAFRNLGLQLRGKCDICPREGQARLRACAPRGGDQSCHGRGAHAASLGAHEKLVGKHAEGNRVGFRALRAFLLLCNLPYEAPIEKSAVPFRSSCELSELTDSLSS